MKKHRSEIMLSIFVLIFIVTGVYTYFTQRPIEEDELIIVSGKLMDTPEIIERGEGMQYYVIKWRLIGNDKVFILHDCSLEEANIDSILRLQPTTNVIMMVKRDKYEKEEMVNVYSMSWGKAKDILSLNDFNRCFSSYWKKLLPFIIITIGIQVYSTFFLKKRNDNLKKFGKS